MTQAQAQTVASALIGAGHQISVSKLPNNDWVIDVISSGVSAEIVANFAQSQSVSATVKAAKLQ